MESKILRAFLAPYSPLSQTTTNLEEERERERGGLCLSSLYRGNDQNVSCNWRERAGGRNSSETKFLFSEGPTSLEEEEDTGKTDRQRTAHQFEPLRK